MSIDRVMPDSGPLGRLAHHAAKQDILDWAAALRLAGVVLIVPEITDYEVRRGLLVSGLTQSLVRLDALKVDLVYQPITTSAMLKAAELWADARRRGKPTADPKELDGDVILAAMAIETKAIIATENVGRLGRYTTARHWSAIVAR